MEGKDRMGEKKGRRMKKKGKKKQQPQENKKGGRPSVYTTRSLLTRHPEKGLRGSSGLAHSLPPPPMAETTYSREFPVADTNGISTALLGQRGGDGLDKWAASDPPLSSPPPMAESTCSRNLPVADTTQRVGPTSETPYLKFYSGQIRNAERGERGSVATIEVGLLSDD